MYNTSLGYNKSKGYIQIDRKKYKILKKGEQNRGGEQKAYAEFMQRRIEREGDDERRERYKMVQPAGMVNKKI